MHVHVSKAMHWTACDVPRLSSPSLQGFACCPVSLTLRKCDARIVFVRCNRVFLPSSTGVRLWAPDSSVNDCSARAGSAVRGCTALSTWKLNKLSCDAARIMRRALCLVLPLRPRERPRHTSTASFSQIASALRGQRVCSNVIRWRAVTSPQQRTKRVAGLDWHVVLQEAASAAAEFRAQSVHRRSWVANLASSRSKCASGWQLSTVSQSALRNKHACPCRRAYCTKARPASVGAAVLDGRAASAAWLQEMQVPVATASAALGRRPGLCVIVVGERADSEVYVARKEDTCAAMRIQSIKVQLSESCTQEELNAAVEAACADTSIDGVLVQLPLPAHLDEVAVMERLNPQKDVDGFHPLNMGRMLARGVPPRFVPATALGVTELLARNSIDVKVLLPRNCATVQHKLLIYPSAQGTLSAR